MAGKKPKNKKASVKYKKYSADGKRKPSCPKCGPGIFLAEHKDRQTCGSCGYTVFKK
ncbi:MAG: 30S ribosomal protein S27ae [Nanoarchaeota archaeon]|nr:30S ribosomal protein S27ae [Nanoarchaeota archaeon]